MAAAIVFRNEIISIGINSNKSHPFQAKYGRNSDSIYLHAEIDAIKNALKCISVDQLTKTTLYICRVKYTDSKKSGQIWGLSRPCEGCIRAITTFNIKKVVYSIEKEGYEIL